jgi:hypothetical protein
MARLLKTTWTDHVTVIAHRGLWGPHASGNWFPENSLLALRSAAENCQNAVELDVKTTQDGNTVLMHDYNLGRTTNIWQIWGGGKYDVWSNSGQNPKVSDVDWGTISRLNLLTADRNYVTGEKVHDIWETFQYWSNLNMNIPMVFDAKNSTDVRNINWAAASNFGQYAGGIVAIKVNATLYQNGWAYRSDAPNVPAIPIFTTNMLSKIDVNSSLNGWIWSGSKAIEINVKDWGGLLQGQLNQVKNTNGMGWGVFNAIPDGPTQWGGFYKNYGQCCYTLSDLYVNDWTGIEYVDRRGDWNYIVNQGFTFVTTDDPWGFGGYLNSRGIKH